MKKILKQMYVNLFMQDKYSIFRANQVRKESKVIGCDWSQKAWKRFGKLWFANQIFFTLMHGFLIKFSTLNHSYIHIHANPIQNNLEAAQKSQEQNLNFLKKTQIWKSSSRSIQATILIPLCSWGFKERIQIKIIIPNTGNR